MKFIIDAQLPDKLKAQKESFKKQKPDSLISQGLPGIICIKAILLREKIKSINKK